MSARVAIKPVLSNLGGDILGVKNARSGVLQKAINDEIRAIFGKKSWASLGVLISVEPETAKKKLAGLREYNQLEIFLLLGALGARVQKAGFKALGIDYRWFIERERALKYFESQQEIKQLELDYQRERELQTQQEISRRSKR